jgi:hypothetical protein
LQYIFIFLSGNKKAPGWPGLRLKKEIYLFFSHFCKAFAAVYRAIFAWFEGDPRLFSAGGAGGYIHFSFGLCRVFALVTAAFTPLRLIDEALGSVKLLFPGGENKFSAALFADESLVFVHLIYLALNKDICP